MMDGEIDSTFQTQQRDIFGSGLVAEIGVNAYAVWSVIKFYADFKTGEAHPGMRAIGKRIGLSQSTVSRAVEVLRATHLLRIVDGSKFKRKGQTYIARERLAIRLAGKIMCYLVVDYVPYKLRGRLERISESLKTGECDPEAWTEIEIIPGDGFLWDEKSKTLKTAIKTSSLPAHSSTGDDLHHQQSGEAWLSKVAPRLAAKCLPN